MDFEQLPATPDWSRYPVGLWGFAGMDRNCVHTCEPRPALRARIGHRGLYQEGEGGGLDRPGYGDWVAESVRWTPTAPG